jgi:hypothetical protein
MRPPASPIRRAGAPFPVRIRQVAFWKLGAHAPLAGRVWPEAVRMGKLLAATGPISSREITTLPVGGSVESATMAPFLAQAGSGRSPTQSSSCRQRNPSACRSSPIRLRLIGTPLVLLRQASRQSSV